MRRPRQHAVFRGHPALTLAAQKAGHALLDAGRAQHTGGTERDEHRALGMLGVTTLEFQFAQFIGRPPARPHARARRRHQAAFQRSAAALVLSL
jgi:hypothetical protein